ncbi:MAG: hypothetical protein COA69_00900 [Robiginitomaculum sp.]|nr:MAG: hypothetical protein COA69_00900 [Robiginitomaculum sp.]
MGSNANVGEAIKCSRPILSNIKNGKTVVKLQSCNRSAVFKRIFDLVFATSMLLMLAPLMVVIACLIRFQDGGKSVYSQDRIGGNGKVFKCLKFRSMIINSKEVLEELLATDPVAAADWEKNQKLKHDPRVTHLGAFIRKTSLDELPQLWNIIRGEMSLVGPRPIVENEVKKYGEFFDYYKSVKPGITGLWQVSGRSGTTYDERVQFDVTYAKTTSFWTDIKIVLGTVPAVLFSKGAY